MRWSLSYPFGYNSCKGDKVDESLFDFFGCNSCEGDKVDGDICSLSHLFGYNSCEGDKVDDDKAYLTFSATIVARVIK